MGQNNTAFWHKIQTHVAPNTGKLQSQLDAPLDREQGCEGSCTSGTTFRSHTIKGASRSLHTDSVMRFSSSQFSLHEDTTWSDRMGIITAITLQTQAKHSCSTHSPTILSAHHASALSCPQTRRFHDSSISTIPQNLVADPHPRLGEFKSSVGTDLQFGLHL